MKGSHDIFTNDTSIIQSKYLSDQNKKELTITNIAKGFENKYIVKYKEIDFCVYYLSVVLGSSVCQMVRTS